MHFDLQPDKELFLGIVTVQQRDLFDVVKKMTLHLTIKRFFPKEKFFVSKNQVRFVVQVKDMQKYVLSYCDQMNCRVLGKISIVYSLQLIV